MIVMIPTTCVNSKILVSGLKIRSNPHVSVRSAINNVTNHISSFTIRSDIASRMRIAPVVINHTPKINGTRVANAIGLKKIIKPNKNEIIPGVTPSKTRIHSTSL